MKKTLFSLFSLYFLLIGMACNSSKKTIIENNTTTETTDNSTTEKTAWNFVGNQNQNLEAILEKATSENKLVFIDAYATWCGPCKLMDRTVFTHSPTADFFNKNFISYKVNVEKDNGPTIQLLYNISALPTLLFLDAKGNTLVKEENSQTVTQLKALADKALIKAKK